MKALLARHHVQGLHEDLPALHRDRQKAVSGNTLGQLVQRWFETFFLEDGSAPPPAIDDTLRPTATYVVDRWFVTMTKEERIKVQAWFEELVDRRNIVVHGFISQYDLWSEAGCAEGNAYLEDFYALLDKVHQVLLAAAASTVEILKLQDSFERSETVRALFDGRFEPASPSVDWSCLHIVQALRQVTGELPAGQWMRLDEALARARRLDADESPQDYGCKSWPHLLHLSRAFDLHYVQEAGKAKVPMIRPRPG